MPQSELPQKAYFSLLDAVRFFAAFWVMNYHYFSVLGLSTDLHWYRYGNLGVQLFFIISGFVIVQSLQGKTLRQFIRGRFVRLFPLFWLLCTVTYILPHLVPHASSVNFWQYLSSMTMLGDTLNGFTNLSGLVDPSYWTLNVELIFYASIALFICLCSYRNIRYFLTGWIIVSVVAFALHIDQNFYVKLALVRHASYFVFGAALALIATVKVKNLYETYYDWALLCVSAGYSLFIIPLALPVYASVNPFDTRIVVGIHIVFFVTIPLLVYFSRSIKNKFMIHTFVILGGITYPLYLLHQKIGNTLINYTTERFGISWNAFAICFEIFIIILSYAIYIQDKKMRLWLLNADSYNLTIRSFKTIHPDAGEKLTVPVIQEKIFDGV